MKKLLIMSLVLIGALTLAGTASASTAETLQPASTITYNDEVVVNNTLKTNSIHVGSAEAGVGGVTYFNGSIVNNSVDEDGNSTIAVTIADDLRVDGEIYRTEKGGDNPLRISDTIVPMSNNTYSLGTSTYQFKDAYIDGTLNTDRLVIGDEDSSLGEAVAGSASDSMVINGDITLNGSIKQRSSSLGVIKAVVQGKSDGTIGSYWTYDGSTVTAQRLEEGYYNIEFAWDITNMFGSATAATASVYTATQEWNTYTNSEKTFVVRTSDKSGLVEDSDYVVILF